MLYPQLSALINLRSVAQRLIINCSSSTMAAGDYVSIFRGMGMEFDAVRDYNFGDDIRHIDWKVTARKHKPHVKTFQATYDRQALLIIDKNAYMRFGTKKTFKSIQAARAAALLGWTILLNQDRLGAIVIGEVTKQLEHIPTTKNKQSLLKLFNLLCAPVSPTISPVDLPAALATANRIIKANTLVFILSDFYHSNLDDLTNSINKLAKKCKVVLLSFYDLADYQLPEQGVLHLEYQGEKINFNCSDRIAREQYYHDWQAYNKSLKHLCNKHGILKIDIATDDDVVSKINKEILYAR